MGKVNIIFFTNTDYFTIEDLKKARKKGFKIVQLELGIEELLKRNRHRVENEGYEDLSIWFKGMVKYQQNIKEKSLVDKVISADQSVKKIATELLSIFS